MNPLNICHRGRLGLPLLGLLLAPLALAGCDDETEKPVPVAEGIFAVPGEILPSATEEQRETFARGEEVATRRLTEADGLGPLFNVTFCAACHEKPVFGGSAGRYRDFYIHGTTTADGAFIEGGERGGILAAYAVDREDPRPQPAQGADTYALRNPIPFFGIGLLAELPEEAILAYADPDDADGDGISGRPNYDRGFVGRFGRKAQTVSIEGFIRGPLFNHLGLTSDPLTEELRARLPVPSNRQEGDARVGEGSDGLRAQRSSGQGPSAGPIGQDTFHQAAAPSEPLFDDDGVADPELSRDDLFDVVSWSMLLAAPQPSPATEQTERGRALFAEVGCIACHVPSLVGERGAIPAYTDLLLHDMGPEMADGLTMGVATGSEFRTQPLWGIGAVGPYLHDGRADTLDDAIRWHGGEGERARDAYAALEQGQQADLIAFLESLGGAEVRTPGLVPPGTGIPEVGAPGGPMIPLTDSEADTWLAGRNLFDRDMHLSEGLGPFLNGDSCRACHFDPVIGGAGPRGVNAMRHGFYEDGAFVAPEGGTGIFKLAVHGLVRPDRSDATVFESRQTPTILGAGALELVAVEAIVGGADPDDLDGDGISGVAHFLPDGRVGRFGWKAQIPDLREFTADALANELHLTIDPGLDLSFARTSDDDDVADPELPNEQFEALAFYIANLAPPMPRAQHPEGETIFGRIGCDACHVPRLTGLPPGAPAAYTDLLLHDVSPGDRLGIADGMASPAEFRTPPLWGLGQSAPYMHNGEAETVIAAIRDHAGEAQASVDDFEALTEAEKQALIDFLEAL